MKTSFRALLSIALASATTDLSAQQVRDSAGLRVLHYPLNAKAPATWSLEQQPVRVIGGGEATGASEFSGVVGVVRLSTGDVAIADRGASEVRLFDARGAFKRNIGRKGRGPGEYDGLYRLLRIADTLVVADVQGRVQVFGPDGSLKRSLPRPVLPDAKSATFLGALADGSMLYAAQTGSYAPAPGTNLLFTNIMALQSADAEPVVAIADVPSFEIRMAGGRPSPLTLGAMGRVVSEGAFFCSTWTKLWEVTCYRGPGKAAFRTVRDVRALPLSEKDKDVYRDRLRRTNQRFPRDSVELWVKRVVFSEQRSTIGRIVLSPTGELWVADYDVTEFIEIGRPGLGTSDHAVTWHVVAPDGRWIADIDMPPRFRLVEVDADYVTGIARDADDVESIVVYRLKSR